MAPPSGEDVKALLRERKYDEAYAMCQAVLEHSPDSFEFNVFAGKCAAELGRTEQVRAVRSSPEEALVMLLRCVSVRAPAPAPAHAHVPHEAERQSA